MATRKGKSTVAMRGRIIAGLLDPDERLAVGLALAHWIERGTDGRQSLRKMKILLTAIAAYDTGAEQQSVMASAAARKAWRTRRARTSHDDSNVELIEAHSR